MARVWNAEETQECQRLLAWGLREDLGEVGDLTSQAVIPLGMRGEAVIRARSAGVVAGLPALDVLVGLLDPQPVEFAANAVLPSKLFFQLTSGETGPGLLRAEILVNDGPVGAGALLARLGGSLRVMLAVERTLLNLLSHLSGIATSTARYVKAIEGTKAVLCDTRKTTPGYRFLSKYAVRIGRGTNHRIGLFDGVLIKDNHLAARESLEGAGRLSRAIEDARRQAPPETVLEVEVDTLDQLRQVLPTRPDIVLLDNMSLEEMKRAVQLRDEVDRAIRLEASGAIRLETIAEVARTGVDRISVGAITHSAGILDLGLDYERVT